ncbi:MAG: retroviral-like aspartic protease family protein [Prevotellaceae bacterium]|jgi:aspartyl protease family protein|nr:retroviral-like aspartic protease family protein [Prevotellaceae bacterium]
MQNKILKLSIIGVLTLSIAACTQKTPTVFKNIFMVEATATIDGFMPFRIFFPKDAEPYVRYIQKDGKLKPIIELSYEREEKDKNSVIYFFSDGGGGVYQVRIENKQVVKLRFISEKLNRDIPYKVVRSENREIIPLEQDGNMRYLTVEVNGMKLKFLLDTGASDILISLAEFTVLYKQGLLKDEDILDESSEMKIADGSVVEGNKIILRTLKIGNKTFKNVKATLFYSPEADLLFGQNVLSQFGKVTIDNKNNELILE